MRKNRLIRRALAMAAVLSLCLSLPQAEAAAYTTLLYGSKGAAVLQLQNALLNLGYNPGTADGKFGKSTETAVKLYQADVGLTADGKAGTLTLNKLYVASSDTSSDTSSTTSAGSSSIVTTNPNTLKYGDTGAKVTALQTALKTLGYDPNGVDGRYGAGTRLAVIRFQTANGLTADGLAGTKTQELLYAQAAGGSSGTSGSSGSASSGSSAGFTRTLRKGYTGSDVTNVQTRLKELGYYSNTIDGSYGTGTMAAVRAFQTANGLTADGLTGSLTYAQLFSSSASSAGTSGSTSGSGTGTGSATAGSSSDAASDSSALRYGATGSAVTKLQKALKALGYNVTTDGDYGALTQAAVAAFQKRNSLTSDGVAGSATVTLLYSGNGLAADPNADSDMIISGDTGKASGPAVSQVQLLHWYNDVKPSLSTGSKLVIFDPSTSLQWNLRVYARGRHSDSEPLTLTDTQIMYKAFGNTNTWTPKAVYVQLPSGTWTLASMHNVPHLSGSISDNGFDGHLCVHFLRDMDECTQNDPNYGVTNQKLIRSTWKKMTGITVD